MPRHPRTVAAALVCVAAACNPLNRQARSASASDEPAVIFFENQSLYEASVYAVPRGGAQRRIGTVQPGRTDTLTVEGPELHASGSVTLVARLLANGRTPSTGPLTLSPGDVLAVTLPPQANLLTVVPAR